MARGSSIWGRRLALAAVLALAAATPGPASGVAPGECGRPSCEAAGVVLWTRRLPGTWVVRNGLVGTTPAQGQAYAALGGQVAVVGAGLTVHAYGAGTGRPLWATTLTGFGAGAAIVSARVWPGVVTVGVSMPPQAGAPSPNGRREEVVLRADTGHELRAYPAAPFGGAVAADANSTVVVGVLAVTSYSNRTGRVLWSRDTGPQRQVWQSDGGHVYVAVSAGGYLGDAPVTALRRIDLRTGDLRVVRARDRAFAGALSLAFKGVVLFTNAHGVTAYSGTTGVRLWRAPGALPESVDVMTGRLYLLDGNVLAGVDTWTGKTATRVYGAAAVASSGLYGVREGVVLGLDHGALGKAWGYDAAAGRVVWTSAPLPWPHYFVDLSGIGGSTSPSQDAVVLAFCGRAGPAPAGGGPQPCPRPELAALNR